MKIRFCLILIFTLFLEQDLQASWSIKLFNGLVYNFDTPLTIHQSGHEDINLSANYETKPLAFPLYYGVRVSKWNQKKAWELEFIHHKLFLINRPPEVQRFSVSHGYNLLIVNRAWQYRKIIFRLGLGAVVAHPETKVRGKEYSEKRGLLKQGYHISGALIQAAVERRIHLFKHLSVSIEGKMTGSLAQIPIEDGKADAPNLALHGLLGLDLVWK